VVWEEIERSTDEETELSAAYLVFLTVATIIAAIGVLLDQPILIVAAMVVGPEFGPLAANAAVALAYGVPDEAAGSALQLLINLAAIVVAGVLTLLVQRVVWSRPWTSGRRSGSS
jgi:uncharacterized membrane protein